LLDASVMVALFDDADKAHEVGELGELIAWMNRYSERGKSLTDLADASLMWLAVKLGTACVLTEDRRDFMRYRLPDGSAFEVLA
jgi:predicted nucleic acid-binding protein